jgi:hypothetical protein
MPTNLPPREPPVSTMLLDIARAFIAVAFFAIALGLLRVRLIGGPYSMAMTGKRIGG